ncbi:NAD(P)-dependent oxidoreductase [Hoeflea ulvae]|uniref:D-isomer specific 2-hydroxyacid dehydrogenase catalytic domain-containing protein n=1 Tax=Hoeflea ulvae TaxID=2983764 RepID=A0ABT3YGV2_9HYPH|nr:NAD(P)-dependent oxidoreductase [Hoeflea ulvae]MCY0095138.1 hypothetical protein [Hoeflea ulvae]
MTKPYLLTFETYDDWDVEPMQAGYTVVRMPASGKIADLPADVTPQITAIAFRGHSRLGPDIIDALPNLGLIANYGVGYDTIDVAHASAKGIKVTNTPDVLTDDVADLSVGMIIAQSRGMLGASEWIRSGNWAANGPYALQTKVSGKKVGVVGLGRVGQAIAERLQPFKVELHYYELSPGTRPAGPGMTIWWTWQTPSKSWLSASPAVLRPPA